MLQKLILSLLILAAYPSLVVSQNLQLHFDPRHTMHKDDFGRNYFTATFEMFKPDQWGSTYMFVDLDMSNKKGNLGLAYTEVMRDQKIGKLPIMAHIEFNGGLGKAGNYAFSIDNAYLVGASYATSVGKFNLSTYVAYKYISFDRESHDIQWTGIWSSNFFDNKLTFSGFVDVWTENKRTTKVGNETGKRVIVLTEPQIWYNATSNLSIGSEVEISNNFLNSKNKAYVNPTLAVKWNF